MVARQRWQRLDGRPAPSFHNRLMGAKQRPGRKRAPRKDIVVTRNLLAWVALLVVAAFRPAPKNLAHLIALSAALILGIQFWYADSGGIYVLWYLPFLILLLVRPNLAEKYPPTIDPATDWLHRARRWAGARMFKQKAQPVRQPVGS